MTGSPFLYLLFKEQIYTYMYDSLYKKRTANWQPAFSKAILKYFS